MTAASVEQAERAATRLLPKGWFTSDVREDVVAGQHYDNLTFSQIGGIPTGDYTIRRETSRQFRLCCSEIEPDQDGNPVERDMGLFLTMEGAVSAIRDDLRLAVADMQEKANRWCAALTK